MHIFLPHNGSATAIDDFIRDEYDEWLIDRATSIRHKSKVHVELPKMTFESYLDISHVNLIMFIYTSDRANFILFEYLFIDVNSNGN